jgi:hypothetical protein
MHFLLPIGAMCRKACGAMLQEMGFKVEFANDGIENIYSFV